MSIVFEHVEGVVQRSTDAEPGRSTPAAPPATPAKPQAEMVAELHQRMERLARRLMAD